MTLNHHDKQTSPKTEYNIKHEPIMRKLMVWVMTAPEFAAKENKEDE